MRPISERWKLRRSEKDARVAGEGTSPLDEGRVLVLAGGDGEELSGEGAGRRG